MSHIRYFLPDGLSNVSISKKDTQTWQSKGSLPHNVFSRCLLLPRWMVCLHVTFLSPCPLWHRLKFSIMSMVTVWITRPNRWRTHFLSVILMSIVLTRMHSSRMRTVRSSGRRRRGCIPACSGHGRVCPGGLSAWGVSPQGGCLPGGVSAWGGSVYPGGVCPSACWDTPPLWKEWQMLVKILPCRNYVADVNNEHGLKSLRTNIR